MHKIKFDFTVSMGNLLTILGGVIVAVMAYDSIEAANAARDVRVDHLAEKVRKNELIKEDVTVIREDTIRLQVGQDNNHEMLVTLVAMVEKLKK